MDLGKTMIISSVKPMIVYMYVFAQNVFRTKTWNTKESCIVLDVECKMQIMFTPEYMMSWTFIIKVFELVFV